MLSAFKMAVKLLCGFVLALVLLEFSLHVCFVSPDQRSYDRFLADVRSQACKQDINKTIFFVGDSTIYGIGTTDQRLYPLPAQFERLLKSHDPDWSCINLGRPSSPTDFHLQVLSSLPDGAIVVYRGGFCLNIAIQQAHIPMMPVIT